MDRLGTYSKAKGQGASVGGEKQEAGLLALQKAAGVLRDRQGPDGEMIPQLRTSQQKTGVE